MILAGPTSPWYTSAAFWGAAGLVGILAVGAATVLVTYFIGSAKRELTYGMQYSSSLLGPFSTSNTRDLKVLYGDEQLRQPNIVWLRLISRGRRDIRSEDFDQGRPILLNVGARIIAVLGSTSDPKRADMPKVAIDGKTLTVGPDLIRKRQTLGFVLLVDGDRPYVSCTARLGDVGVRRQRPDDGMPKRLIWLPIVGGVIGIAATVAGFATGGKSNQTVAPIPAITLALIFISALGFFICVITMGYAAGYRRTRRLR